jgi:hypothetical protein
VLASDAAVVGVPALAPAQTTALVTSTQTIDVPNAIIIIGPNKAKKPWSPVASPPNAKITLAA